MNEEECSDKDWPVITIVKENTGISMFSLEKRKYLGMMNRLKIKQILLAI